MLASCGAGLSLGPDALNGRWVAVDEPPGMSLHIILLSNNGSVTGSGSWTGEAIVGGDVTATGQVSGRDVVLDLTFDHVENGVPIGTPFTEHLEGVFTSNNDIEGTTTQDGAQGKLHLQRLTGP
jgi:hypothetical protein